MNVLRFQELEQKNRKIEKDNEVCIDMTKPLIVRMDGHCFKTFTKGFEKPFDAVFRNAMKFTMKSLCETVPNCVFGYTASDEITLVLLPNETGYEFRGRKDKLMALYAARATRFFNKHFMEQDVEKKYEDKYFVAEFDAKVTNFEYDDILENVAWRQEDMVRNSKAAVAQTYFSQKELDKVSTNGMVKKLLDEKNIDWNEFSNCYKWGYACYSIQVEENVSFVHKRTNKTETVLCTRNRWFIDENMPYIDDNPGWFVDILNKAKEKR